jgi:glucose/mannose-6-phosphate isomerase
MANLRLLDEPSAIASADPSRMRDRLLSLAAQARLGWELGSKARIADQRRRPRHVVIAGMGGSGIGAALVKGIADLTSGAVPVTVWRDYGMPAWVDADTLVMAVSVSGGTVETRSAFEAARRQGARCLAITGPRELFDAATSAGINPLRIDHRGEPRAALGYTFIAPYRALQVVGALPDASDEFSAAVGGLDEMSTALAPESPSASNRAKQLAADLMGRLPVVYGARHLSGVAIRWKTQFNENADSWAITEDMPEANHNGVQGYRLPEKVRQIASVLVLDSPSLSEEIRIRLRLTAELMREEGVTHRLVEIDGGGLLADVLRGCLLGDMTSYYLALLEHRDPSVTAALTRLKNRTDASTAARA